RAATPAPDYQESVTEAVVLGACRIAAELGVSAILCSTTSGATPRAMARLRPRMPLIAATSDESVRRPLCLTWGVRLLRVPRTTDTDEPVAAAVEGAVTAGWIQRGELVVIVAGTPIGTPGHTDLVKVHRVA